jgi:hypothetical protein
MRRTLRNVAVFTLLLLALPAPLHAAAPRMPAFSWDTVPTGMPPRKRPPFTDEDYSRMARHYIVVSGEAPELAAQLKTFNADVAVVGYKNLVLHVQTTADPLFRDHPDWFLYDRQGKPQLNGRAKFKRPMYDLRKPQVREYWLGDVERMLNHPLLDGMFLDAYAKVVQYGPVKQSTGQDPPTDFIAGYRKMMDELLKRRAHTGKFVIGNFLRADKEDCAIPEVMKYLDGSYLEHFEKPPEGQSYEEYVAKGIQAVQQVAQTGKIILLRLSALDDPDVVGNASDVAGSNGETWLTPQVYENLEYKLAIFLICAERYSYFSYYTPAPAKTSEELAPDFPEFKKPLGPPKGPAVKNGFTYTRQFQYASVWLDLAKRQGRITWKASYPEPKTLSPQNGDDKVAPGEFQCTVTFDRPIQKGDGVISLFRMSDRQRLASVPVDSDAVTSHGDRTAVIQFPTRLEPHTQYSISVAKGAFRDGDGLVFLGTPVLGEWKFTTR